MNTTQFIQAINVTLSDYLFLCYWESKWALLEPFIVKGVRNWGLFQKRSKQGLST